MDEDQLILADKAAEAQRNRGIEMARKASLPESDPDFDGKNCIECEQEIHPGRLALGKIRCIHCAQALELRKKLGIF